MRRAAKQIGRVIRDEERRIAELMDLAPHSSDRLVGIEEQVRSDTPDRDNDFRLHEFYLALEVRTARCRLVGLRITIVRRPAFQDIGNEYTGAAFADRAQHLVEQFARTPNERFTTTIFLGARSLPDDHPVGDQATNAKNGLGSRLVQPTASAARHGRPELIPVELADRILQCLDVGFGVSLVTRYPDIDTHRAQIGTALKFCLHHLGIQVLGFSRKFATAVTAIHRMARSGLKITRQDGGSLPIRSSPAVTRRPGSTSTLLSIGRCTSATRVSRK